MAVGSAIASPDKSAPALQLVVDVSDVTTGADTIREDFVLYTTKAAESALSGNTPASQAMEQALQSDWMAMSAALQSQVQGEATAAASVRLEDLVSGKSQLVSGGLCLVGLGGAAVGAIATGVVGAATGACVVGVLPSFGSILPACGVSGATTLALGGFTGLSGSVGWSNCKTAWTGQSSGGS